MLIASAPYIHTAQNDSEPSVRRWGRLTASVRSRLRRGAWYPVLSLSPEEVVLDVHHRSTIVPRYLIEVRESIPMNWSIVPTQWGGPYLVCPRCAERVRVRELPHHEFCVRCRQQFEVEAAHEKQL